MRRIKPQVEQQVLTQILLGQSYADIAMETGVAVSTIKKIKTRNNDFYQSNKDELERWTSDQAKTTLQCVHKLISGILDEALLEIRDLSVDEVILISDRVTLYSQIESTAANNTSFSKKNADLDRLLSKLTKKRLR